MTLMTRRTSLFILRRLFSIALIQDIRKLAASKFRCYIAQFVNFDIESRDRCSHVNEKPSFYPEYICNMETPKSLRPFTTALLHTTYGAPQYESSILRPPSRVLLGETRRIAGPCRPAPARNSSPVFKAAAASAISFDTKPKAC